MTAFNGWVHDRFGTAWMLHAEALFAIACVVLALVVLRKINLACMRNAGTLQP
jgi:predicted 3-demethylubiquinone-9 3-methyltransferase (glyoxalase superfamily)